METTFEATLSQGRQKLCVIFSHPMIPKESTGKPGMRVRRGLGTDNREEAQAIITDLNAILANRDFHKPGARELAARKFRAKAVSAFYDHDRLRAAVIDPWEKRNEVLPLPTAEAGYSVVQVVGSFGVGKTTLVQQLIGTNQGKGSFPAKGKGRTTICDTEIICAAGDYSAAVSFASRDRIRGYIEECVEASVRAAAEGSKDESVAQKFLVHSENRFRLSYILGKAYVKKSSDTPDGEFDEDEEDEETDDELMPTADVTEHERNANAKRLADWIERCKAIAGSVNVETEGEMGGKHDDLPAESKNEFFERLYKRLKGSEDLQATVDDVLDAVEERFSLLSGETVDTDSSGWPLRWQMTSSDRTTFLRQVSRFSSNYERQFGRLLTPLVDGIRVKGPFKPVGWAINPDVPAIVILDGEGLGHVSSTATSVPTSVTRRFEMAHAILLVDTAEKAMDVGPQTLLRRVVATGHEKKLAVVFTHFDQMKADTFADGADKQSFVTASLESAIATLDDALDSQTGASRRVRRQLADHVFFVGRLHERLDVDSKKTKGTRKALNSLLDFLIASGRPEVPTEAIPSYDLAYLYPGIEKATGQFQKTMNAQLFGEHWKRIEALTRRFAKQWDDGYLHLRPVASLQALLEDRLAVFWATPKSWKPANCTQEAKDAAVRKVTREFSSRVEKYVSSRFRQDYMNAWSEAYGRSGPGSGKARARDVRAIDEEVAPVPSEERMSKLFDDVRQLCREAIAAAGFEVTSA